jgi:hypothetical protein
MITKPRRRARTTPCVPTWLLHLLCVSLCVASAHAEIKQHLFCKSRFSEAGHLASMFR